MHFFIEHNKLTDQLTSGIKYGVDSLNTSIYNVTSQFQLNEIAKVFACQDSFMIVQQSDFDDALVNIILKPIEGLKIPFNSVQYFVYRGIAKNSFFSGNAIKPETETDKSELLVRVWKEFNDFKTNHPKGSVELIKPQDFGFDNSLSTTLNIESIYDYSQPNIRPIFVKEGEWIGNFAFQNSSSISINTGFEIIQKADTINVDLQYVRAEKYSIDVSGLTGLELRAKREQILSFIDPAAFFGLHYGVGVSTSTFDGTNKSTLKKKANDLYSSLLEKFATKNRIYLDIRSELGYSYNFYQNYNDGSGNNIKIGNSKTSPVEQVYAYNAWPIVVIDTLLETTANKNDIKINLRIDDNTKPILFFEDTKLISEDSNSHFIDHTKILNGADEWSKDLNFVFPNTGNGTEKENVAYYIQLQYFRQLDNTNTILKTVNLETQSNFNTIFTSLDTLNLGDTNYRFQQVSNEHLSFIEGALPNGKPFSGVAVSGANFDDNRIIFHTRMLFPQKTTGEFYLNTTAGINEGFSLDGNFNQMSFLKKDIYSSAQSIQENDNSELIKILDVTAYNDFPGRKEDLFILGLMQSELSALKNVTGLSNQHSRYIGFEDISPNPAEDINGISYRKYKLNVQGLNDSGSVAVVYPSSDIYVFTNSDFVFSSKDFSDAEPPKQQINGKCPKCSEEFTAELICKTLNIKVLSSQQQTIISSIIPYLNKYRQNFGLDTCLRKAHFIAQIALESSRFTTFEESEVYPSSITLGVFSKNLIIIDSIMINSLKDYLSSIFKLIDRNGKELIKSNEELGKILLAEKPLIIDGELYGRYKGGDKLIKQVFNADNTLKYKIFIKDHTYFGIPMMSRAYAPYSGDKRGLGNGDELTRDGWKFKGRGLKQITGRALYKSFSNYRNTNPFPDDSSGAIDFTEENSIPLNGNYLMISQNSEYATQSAIWFWNGGNRYNKKTAKEYADIDDVDSVSKTINRYATDTFAARRQFYYYASIAFDILGHKEYLKQ